MVFRPKRNDEGRVAARFSRDASPFERREGFAIGCQQPRLAKPRPEKRAEPFPAESVLLIGSLSGLRVSIRAAESRRRESRARPCLHVPRRARPGPESPVRHRRSGRGGSRRQRAGPPGGPVPDGGIVAGRAVVHRPGGSGGATPPGRRGGDRGRGGAARSGAGDDRTPEQVVSRGGHHPAPRRGYTQAALPRARLGTPANGAPSDPAGVASDFTRSGDRIPRAPA